MKFIEKVTLVIYSCLMLVISIISCLLVFGWIEFNFVSNFIHTIIVGDTTGKIILGLSILFILLSIKCIFFDSNSKDRDEENKEGVLLENESGKLLISKETLENLVNSVALNFKSTDDVTTKVILDKDNNVSVYVNLIVKSDVIIKDLSAELQSKIKEKIKTATDLDVKEVNITVKKVAEKEEIQENKA